MMPLCRQPLTGAMDSAKKNPGLSAFSLSARLIALVGLDSAKNLDKALNLDDKTVLVLLCELAGGADDLVDQTRSLVDYVLKSVRRRRFSTDQVFVLPRAVSELR